jgi:hypothetical protein
MNATCASYALSALLACTLAGTSAHAVDAVASGSKTSPALATSQAQEAAGADESAQRSVASRGNGDVTKRRSNAENSAVPSGQLLASPQTKSRALMPHHSGRLHVRDHANVSTPAASGAIGHLGSRPNAGHPANHFEPAAGAVRALRAPTAAAAAGHQFSKFLRAANRPTVSLKVLAGNGVIGGAFAPGRGMIGGTASSRTVSRTSIDGTALRRRF